MNPILSLTFSNLYVDDRPTTLDSLKPYKLQLNHILKQWIDAPINELDFSAQKKLYKDTDTLLNKLLRLNKEEQQDLKKEALKLCSDYSAESWNKSVKWIGYHNEAYSSFQRLIHFCAALENKQSEDIIPGDIHNAVLRHMQHHPYQLSKLPPDIVQQIFLTNGNASTLIKEPARLKLISKDINVQLANIRKLVINPILIGSKLKRLGPTPKLETLKFTNSRGIDPKWLESQTSVKSVNVNEVRDLKFLTSLKDGLLKLKLSKIYRSNLDQLSRFTNLKTLKLQDAFQLEDIGFLSDISNRLETLEISKAGNLDNFDSLAKLSGLVSLNLSNTELKNLKFLEKMKKLKHLNLSECRYITNLEDLNHCSSTLETLNLKVCCGIKDFEILNNLSSLKAIDITGCQVPQKIVDSLKTRGVLIKKLERNKI